MRYVLAAWRRAKRFVVETIRFGLQVARAIRRAVSFTAQWVPAHRFLIATTTVFAAAITIPMIWFNRVPPPAHVEPRVPAVTARSADDAEQPHARVVHATPPPIQPVLDVLPAPEPAGRSTLELHSWPPSTVYIDDERYVEAPSPNLYVVEEGTHEIAFVPRLGTERRFTLYFRPDVHYKLMYNFENGRVQQEVWDQ